MAKKEVGATLASPKRQWGQGSQTQGDQATRLPGGGSQWLEPNVCVCVRERDSWGGVEGWGVGTQHTKWLRDNSFYQVQHLPAPALQ